MKKTILVVLCACCFLAACKKQNAAENKQTESVAAETTGEEQEQVESAGSTQTGDGPTYLTTFLGGYAVCEFAENGIQKEELEFMRPYIQKGRLYFICEAIACTSGNLKRGFEFQLWDDTYKIRARYQGNEKFSVKAGTIKDGPWIYIAGYAESGKIIVTRVFLEMDSATEFSETVKTFGEIKF